MLFNFAILTLISWTECMTITTSRIYSPGNCSNLQFECDDGECIPKEKWCNNYYTLNYYKSCSDGSSTKNCHRFYPYCTKNQTWCEERDKKCIPKKWICDGYEDCNDGSDEQECLGSGERIKDIPGIIYKRQEAESGLFKLRKPNWDWGKDTARAIVALYFSNPDILLSRKLTSILMIKQLHIQLLNALLRNSTNYFPTHKMALYIHALLATCSNPFSFYGYDLIEELEKRFLYSKIINPFVALVLCNARSSVLSTRSQELVDMMKKPNNRKWIDAKALALLAMVCMINSDEYSYDTLFSDYIKSARNITSSLKNLQRSDGSFGNIYTTAVITQALNAADDFSGNWNQIKVLRYLGEKRNPDNLPDIISTYFTLPLFHGKTFVDLGKVNCSSNFSGNQYYSMEETFNAVHSGKKVEYSIWKEEYVFFRMIMKVREKATLYEVMRLAEELDPKCKFQDDNDPSDLYLMSGTANDPEARKYWQLYRITANGTEPINKSPDEIIPEDGDSYVYWYNSIEEADLYQNISMSKY